MCYHSEYFSARMLGVFKAFHAIQVLNEIYSFQISKLNFLLDYMKPFQVWNFSLVKYFQNMIYLITKSLINRRFSSTLLVLTGIDIYALKTCDCFQDKMLFCRSIEHNYIRYVHNTLILIFLLWKKTPVELNWFFGKILHKGCPYGVDDSSCNFHNRKLLFCR